MSKFKLINYSCRVIDPFNPKRVVTIHHQLTTERDIDNPSGAAHVKEEVRRVHYGATHIRLAKIVLPRVRKGQHLFFWYSASDVASVRFIKWVRMRMHTGGKDTNKLGVGAKVSSSLLFSAAVCKRIDKGCRRGEGILRPYWDLYRSRDDAYRYRNPVIRPELKRVK